MRRFSYLARRLRLSTSLQSGRFFLIVMRGW